MTEGAWHPPSSDPRWAAELTAAAPPATLSRMSSQPPKSNEPWWRTAAVYQVYVRSFFDTAGDGLGDLPGVTTQIPYLAALGVDAIWLSPVCRSPQADAGYDVADYRDIDPLFGTLADFDALLATAHGAGLRVIVDLVPNHTSSEHRWFREALASPPRSAARARYLFRPGRDGDDSQPPNDWLSMFGGSAWTRVEGPGSASEWYLHLFAEEQPDLDWTNGEVRDEFDSILRFWLDRGVDGFRVDVTHGLAKDPALPDLAGQLSHRGGRDTSDHPHWDRDEVHDVYRRWRTVTDAYDGERMFVGEAWVSSPRRLARYVRGDELHTTFDFDFLRAEWDATSFRRVIDETVDALASVGATPTWVLSNHDVIRPVTRYGDGDAGRRRARAAALLMFALPGGAYVYQGEELGLEEVRDIPDDCRQDPVFLRSNGTEIGRDGCRVPLPWSGAEPPFGFSSSEATWLPQPLTWSGVAVEHQAVDPTSTLSLYREALRLRREILAGAGPALEWVAAAPGVLAFRRTEAFACVVNVGSEPADLPEAFAGSTVLLASEPSASGDRLPGDSALWLST